MESTEVQPPVLEQTPAQSPAEAPQNPADAQPRKRNAGLIPFNAGNAREMALRSWVKRKARKEELEKRALHKGSIPQNVDPYVAERIERTRAQIAELDRRLERASDPKDIKALCESIAKLAEVERVLCGRPLPGSRRPGRDLRTKSATESTDFSPA